MPYLVPIQEAAALFPEFTFVSPLTPSAQKAAFHVRTASQVDLCLKLIAPDADVDRLHREILALQRLDHPNVAKILEYECSTKGGRYRHYILERFIAGSDLADQLRLGQAWPRARVKTMFRDLALGLAALDDIDVVHRDLKPTNVRVTTSDQPVIIDFGLARLLEMPDLTRTSDGAAIGTPSYFAPEQFCGTKYDIDHRTDLFAYGIMLFHALCGIHPFYSTGMSYEQLKSAVSEREDYCTRSEFVALPSHWRLVVKRLLSRDRHKRPPGAAQVADLVARLE